MDWFKPTSETVAYVAENCLIIVILTYLFSLKQKTKISYLFIGFMLSFFIFAIANIFITASFPTTNSFLTFCNGATVSLLEYFWLLIALYFPKNYHPKESITILLLMLIPTVYPLLSDKPDAFTLDRIIVYNLLFIYIIWNYTRNIKRLNKDFEANVIGLLEFEKEKKFYKTNIFSALSNLFLFSTLLLVGFNLLSLFVWTILLHILILAAFTLINYSVLNYTNQLTSFRTKLTGIVLCVVLIVLGILPFLLLGSTWFDQTGNKMINEADKALPQSILTNFIIVIPIVTLVIVTLFPLLFKNEILRPLNKILSGVKQVNSGKLDTEIIVEVNDEIGALSNNFNQMTSSLKLYANKMNDLVDERTNKLNQSLQELKSTQQQLIQSEKMASLGELTAGIAHEIQNPLNFVNNFSEINNELIEEMNAETNVEEIKAIASDIKQNNEKITFHGKRADAIVKGMLQHSRKNTGLKEPTDINKLADEYLRMSFHGLRAKDKNFTADFKTDFDEIISQVEIVPQDMGRVLLNLFNNAFYAVNEKKKTAEESYQPLVSVQTKKLNDSVEIVIKDNGNGIPQHIRNKIFQPFFTTKPTGDGTGLGLSLSYDIITKEHNGTIQVQSEENNYTAFIITLPS